MNKRLERILACLSSARDSAPGQNCGLCDRDESAHADWCPLPGALADAEALLTADGLPSLRHGEIFWGVRVVDAEIARHESIAEGRGMQAERAAVVAWLRAMPGFDDAYEGALLRMAAEGIETGDHVGAADTDDSDGGVVVRGQA